MAVECGAVPRDCPWCKKDTTVGRESGGGTFQDFVLCLHCGAQGPKRDTHEEAIRDWNVVANIVDPLPTMSEMREHTFGKLSKGDKVGSRGEEYTVVGRKRGDSTCLRVVTVSGNLFIIREHDWIENHWVVTEWAEKEKNP